MSVALGFVEGDAYEIQSLNLENILAPTILAVIAACSALHTDYYAGYALITASAWLALPTRKS